MQSILYDLIAAHNEVAPLFQTVPEESFALAVLLKERGFDISALNPVLIS